MTVTRDSFADQWLGAFPAEAREAVRAAFATGSLGKVRRALRLLEAADAARAAPRFQIALAATFNLEPVRPFLDLAFHCLPSSPEIEIAPLDSIESYLLSARPSSTQATSSAAVLWRLEELFPEIFFPFSHGFSERLEGRLEEIFSRIDRVVGLHNRSNSGTPLFISTVPIPSALSNSLFAAQHRTALHAVAARLNTKIYDAATASPGVHVIDFAAWAAREGQGCFDPAMDFLARQPISGKSQASFALFVAGTMRPLVVPRRKALAVDVDETLWGGIVGEDGITGLKLGHDFPGNVHLRIQRELLELRNRGVLLVLLSKNNEADAREAFDRLPDMLLKWDDFALHKVNWQHKHRNLVEAANQLGLGLDSFCLIDDSEYEREQVRQFLPEVLVLNSAGDALAILRALWQTDVFDNLQVSEEDTRRHNEYGLRQKRTLPSGEGDLETFLFSLHLQARIEPVGPGNIDRVVTLLGKTNQFNVTARRHSYPQVQAILETPGSIGLALRLADRFGDQGLIAVLLAIPTATGSSTLEIDSFLVSCRALGRGVEDALWSILLRLAEGAGFRRIEAEYTPTPRNGLVADLYDRLGLKLQQRNSSGARYFLEPVEIRRAPRWIEIRDEAFDLTACAAS